MFSCFDRIPSDWNLPFFCQSLESCRNSFLSCAVFKVRTGFLHRFRSASFPVRLRFHEPSKRYREFSVRFVSPPRFLGFTDYINWSYSLSACHIHLSFSPSSSVSGFLIPNSQFQIPNSSSARPKDSILSSPTRSALPRKEVIQPHLPIRLPCYDFTPVIGLTFGS